MLDLNSCPLISIVIPVFNSENDLKKCIDSILIQSFSKIELICIDDGSQDSSFEILQGYSIEDNRVKVIKQENKGPAAARNLGLSKACGKYVWFVDSDDWLNQDSVAALADCIRINESDIIGFRGYAIHSKTQKKYTNDRYRDLNVIPDDRLHKVLTNKNNNSFLYSTPLEAWSRIFKRSFLLEKNIFFEPSLVVMDDSLFVMECFLKANTVFYTKLDLYNYNIGNESSVSNSIDYYDLKKCLTPIFIAKKCDQIMKELCVSESIFNAVKVRNLDRIVYFYNKYKGKNKRDLFLQVKEYLISSKYLLSKSLTKIDKFNILNDLIKYNYLVFLFKNFFFEKQVFNSSKKIKIFKLSIYISGTTNNNDILVKRRRFLFLQLYKRKSTLKSNCIYLFGLKISENSLIFKRFVHKPNINKIFELKGAYAEEKRLFIIGNGPSLNLMDLSVLNNEKTFVLNRSHFLKEKGLYRADFYCMSDRFAYQNYGHEIDLDYADRYFASTWTGWNLSNNVYLYDMYSRAEIRTENQIQFDMTMPIYLGRTVALDALQIAVYLGFKKIYFIGVDLSFGLKDRHFYRSNEGESDAFQVNWSTSNEINMIENFKHAFDVLKKNNIEIYNAGIGGMLNTIPRVDFNSLFLNNN
jgi:glycosyltransferase involved in cell wall biosynthesis